MLEFFFFRNFNKCLISDFFPGVKSHSIFPLTKTLNHKMRSVITLLCPHFVVPNIIHTSHREGIFLRSPPSLWKFQSSFIHLIQFWDPPPPPRNFQSLLRGEYGYFLKLHIAPWLLYVCSAAWKKLCSWGFQRHWLIISFILTAFMIVWAVLLQRDVSSWSS